MKNKLVYLILSICLLGILGILNYNNVEVVSLDDNNIPKCNNGLYVIVDDNNPHFENDLFNTNSFEKYSDQDLLGRSGIALANISVDLMPTTKRESIGMIKPSGWHTVKYDFIDGKYLYNRCHLIGYQLTGENANPNNLITCTRNMNTNGMIPFENQVANYIRKTNNHVLYRVTPIYKNSNLIASGVQIEAQSVEDDEIKFNVFVCNKQDNIEINYETGESKVINEPIGKRN